MEPDIHFHIIERTGMMGISQYDRKVPCSKCDWGHSESARAMDKIADRVRLMRTQCRAEAVQRGHDRGAFFEGEMRGYWNVLSLICPNPNDD